LNTKKFVTVPGLNADKTIFNSGETYWQVGLTQIEYPSNCLGVKLTFTADTNTSVNFYVQGSSNFNMIVNWGDGNTSSYSNNSFYSPNHTYALAGTYEVQIGFNNCRLITQLSVIGTPTNRLPLVNFSGLENLTSLSSLNFGYTYLQNFNPAVQLPASLVLLLIYNNLLTEFNPTLPLPTGLAYLNLNGNFINTFDPTLPLPTSLISLDLGGNKLTSFNPTILLPSGLRNLNLSINLITSFTPTLQLPLTLAQISLNVNPMNQTEVNNSLIYLVAIPWTSVPPKNIDLLSTDVTAIPFGAGLIAKNNLISPGGWSVTTW
jgi:Leucine-rich repeat (LRR) protein